MQGLVGLIAAVTSGMNTVYDLSIVITSDGNRLSGPVKLEGLEPSVCLVYFMLRNMSSKKRLSIIEVIRSVP